MSNFSQRCLECNGKLIQTESDVVCGSCGLVANKIYKNSTIQLIKTDKSYGNQFGSISESPTTMKTLGTYIGYNDTNLITDAQGLQLKIPAKRKFYRLKPLNNIHSRFKGRQQDYRGYLLLTAVCSSLEITDTTKANALYLFQKVYRHLKGSSTLSNLAMGSLYLAIRARKENIELLRLVSTAQNRGYCILGKDIIKAASLIRQHVKIRISYVKSEEYLDNIIGRLAKNSVIQKSLNKRILSTKDDYFFRLKLVAKKLLNNFPQKERGGRNPFLLATAIIVASDVLLARHAHFPHLYKKKSRRGIITQKISAEILDLAEFSLREHYLFLAKPLMEEEILSNRQIDMINANISTKANVMNTNTSELR